MTERHVVLISGGKDSAAAAHYTVNKLDVDIKCAVYLDTRVGCDKNREYVEQLADSLGLQLWTLRTHESYEEKVKEHGFPGPSRHFIMYSLLKERQLGRLATMTGGDLHLWTGVRKQESDRRMKHVEPEKEADRWTWHAPLCWQGQRWVDAYIDNHDIPESDLWTAMGRSADCFCGCFGSPEELIDAEAADCTDIVAKLRRLEEEVDTNDEKSRWAWNDLSDVEKRAERVDDDYMFLCGDCE